MNYFNSRRWSQGWTQVDRWMTPSGVHPMLLRARCPPNRRGGKGKENICQENICVNVPVLHTNWAEHFQHFATRPNVNKSKNVCMQYHIIERKHTEESIIPRSPESIPDSVPQLQVQFQSTTKNMDWCLRSRKLMGYSDCYHGTHGSVMHT